MTVAEERPTGYRFGPRETSGVILGLRIPQLLLLFTGLAAFVAGLAAGPVGLLAGVIALLACMAVAFVPAGGRTVEAWLPIIAGHAYGRLTGQRSYRRQTVPRGHHPGQPLPLDLPGVLAGLTMLTVDVGEGMTLGILKDAPRHTFTAVAQVTGRSFTLLEAAERDRRVHAWGAALSALSREGSPVARVQWVERTLPDSGDALHRWFAAHTLPTPPPAPGVGATQADVGTGTGVDEAPWVTSYRELIADAAPVTQTHETYLALTIDTRKARRQIRQSGGGDTGAVHVLTSELTIFEERLRDAEIDVQGWLHPRDMSRVLRTAFELGSNTWLDTRTPEAGAGAGVAPHVAGPAAAETHWSHYRTDDGLHATYTITEWPRLEVGADFLAPLLIDLQVRRSISVIAEPIPPRRAARTITAARTKEVTDAALRDKTKQVTTARQRAEAAELDRREAELVAGHADYRFTAFATVSAPDRAQLDRDSLALENAAYQSRLELRRLYGEQDQAFAFTLPVGRGLR